MNKLELLKASINKAIQNNDTKFIEDLIDLLSIDILENMEDEWEYLLRGLYEYCKSDYEKAKYFANMAYSKGIRQAQIILDLIESSNLFQNVPDENKILSFIIKKSDDIFIMTFTILRYYRYLLEMNKSNPEVTILKLINSSIEIYPQIDNLYILKAYIMYEIFKYNIDTDFIEKTSKILQAESREMLMQIISRNEKY
ncbi:MAG: hypothetical protein RMJ36_06125 [Candidatus Calescibacterium sp.]|nr:hypothetical protein [Candidatus Calescibacterium sp.]MDW8133213.1 hypothetical protein [Candidatus Calescibacterium sp.]